MSTAGNMEQRQLIIDVAAKYNKNDQHSFSVENISLKLFDSLSGYNAFTSGERNLLSHASLLHDIGNFINEKKHHEHTKYIIDTDEMLTLYPPNERRLLSLIAYNHRKKTHSDVKLLSKIEKEMVLRLSSILRVADSLDYSRGTVDVKAISVQNSEIRILIGGELPEKMTERLQRKKSLFCKIFKLEISFS